MPIFQVRSRISNRGKGQYHVTITAPDGDTRIYNTGYNVVPTVVDGQHVEAGDELTPGSLNPHDLLRIKGVQQLQSYLLREVQTVYKRQSVEIGDKHIELIVRQMLRKVRVEDAGDTELLPGEMVDIYRVEAINAKTAAEGGAPATSRRVLLGITKASLGNGILPFRSVLPGDNARADRCGDQGQGRSVGRLEGECNDWKADSCRNGLKALSGCGDRSAEGGADGGFIRRSGFRRGITGFAAHLCGYFKEFDKNE